MQHYFWGKPTQHYPQLQQNSHTTVAVLGAGIAGLSAAIMLQDAGIKDVTIVEKHLVGSGSTGNSAGMLVCEPEQAPWINIVQSLGLTQATAYLKQQNEAVKWLKSIVEKHTLQCELREVDLLLFHESVRSQLREDSVRNSMHQAHVTLSPSAFHHEFATPAASRATRIAGNLSVNPLLLTRELARLFTKRGGRLFEQTPGVYEKANTLKCPGAELTFDYLIDTAVTHPHQIDMFLTTICVTWPLKKHELTTLHLKDHDMFLTNPDLSSYFYGRITPDNRLLIGYGDLHTSTFHRTSAYEPHVKTIKEFLTILVPDIKLPITHGWSGVYSLSKTVLPYSSHPSPRVWKAGGFGTQLAAIATMREIVHDLCG